MTTAPMHQSICECGTPDCPTDCGYFYTSIQHNGQSRLLLGPFPTHADALAAIDVTKELAERFDRRAYWYAYGTARTEQNIRPIFTACEHCGEIGHYSHRTCACFGGKE